MQALEPLMTMLTDGTSGGRAADSAGNGGGTGGRFDAVLSTLLERPDTRAVLRGASGRGPGVEGTKNSLPVGLRPPTNAGESLPEDLMDRVKAMILKLTGGNEKTGLSPEKLADLLASGELLAPDAAAGPSNEGSKKPAQETAGKGSTPSAGGSSRATPGPADSGPRSSSNTAASGNARPMQTSPDNGRSGAAPSTTTNTTTHPSAPSGKSADTTGSTSRPADRRPGGSTPAAPAAESASSNRSTAAGETPPAVNGNSGRRRSEAANTTSSTRSNADSSAQHSTNRARTVRSFDSGSSATKPSPTAANASDGERRSAPAGRSAGDRGPSDHTFKGTDNNRQPSSRKSVKHRAAAAHEGRSPGNHSAESGAPSKSTGAHNSPKAANARISSRSSQASPGSNDQPRSNRPTTGTAKHTGRKPSDKSSSTPGNGSSMASDASSGHQAREPRISANGRRSPSAKQPAGARNAHPPETQSPGSADERAAASSAEGKRGNNSSSTRQRSGGAPAAENGIAGRTTAAGPQNSSNGPSTDRVTTARQDAGESGRDTNEGNDKNSQNQQQSSNQDTSASARQTASNSAAGQSAEVDSDRSFSLKTGGPEPDSGEKTIISQESGRTTETSGKQKSSGGQRSSRPRHSFLSAAWRRAAQTGGSRTYRLENGWHVLRMDLEEESSQMTVKARRSEEKVSVSVGMSDPKLRAIVAANTDRLQAALKAEYNADIDFTLSSDDGQSTGDANDRTSDNRGRQGRSPAGMAEAGQEEDVSPSPGRALHGSFEWIG